MIVNFYMKSGNAISYSDMESISVKHNEMTGEITEIKWTFKDNSSIVNKILYIDLKQIEAVTTQKDIRNE